MVCLSFEQSVLKNKQTKKKTQKSRKKKKNPGGEGGGWFIRKTMLSGLFVLLCFYTCLVFIQGASMWHQERHGAFSPAEHLCFLPWLPKKPLQVCHLAAGTLRPFSVTSHDNTGIRTLCARALSLGGQVCMAWPPPGVWLSLCVHVSA